MNRDPSTSPQHVREASGISVRGLGYAYRRGGEELFRGLDHEFSVGALTAITGASGRGKSTLLYVLGLMLRPQRGGVFLDDRSVHDLPDHRRSEIRATSIGFVFQDAVLDPSRPIIDSVIEPALYAGDNRMHALPRAIELLDSLGLAVRADHRPGQISGGQAQRAAVARSLMNDPSVVLADEPTGNLDETNTGIVLDALRAVAASGRSVILATHDPRVVERADHVLEL